MGDYSKMNLRERMFSCDEAAAGGQSTDGYLDQARGFREAEIAF